MTNNKLKSILDFTPKEKIFPEQKKYIELCKEISEIGERYFEKNDFFFHEEFGINKVSTSQNNGKFYSYADPTCEIDVSESTWLPTVDQIKDLYKEHGCGHMIDQFDLFKNRPELIDSCSWEEQWLLFYRSIMKN